MLAKLVVHAPTREAAIDRALRAIDAYEIHGVPTTLDFCRFAIDHEAFRSGDFDTHFVGQFFSPDQLIRPTSLEADVVARLAHGLVSRSSASNSATPVAADGVSPWRRGRRVFS
jgi:propionyl-CoA carboxylase alpha chain